jgi:uncharacterized protein (TIGR03118 family)
MLQKHSLPRFATLCTLALAFASPFAHADSFTQTNLVSDIPGKANTTDPNLINPWGVSFNATSPFWTANQGTGTATLFDGAGNINPLVVSIPGSTTGAPPTGPTGTVFNTGTGFTLTNGGSALFVFDTLNGTIVGWNGGSGTNGQVVATTAGAVFTGLAQASNGTATLLYAANSAPGGGIDVFDSSWAPKTVSGGFVDPNLPAGFVPFNIQAIGGNLYVTYAQLGPGGAPMPGGFVDEYDANGNLLHRIASGGPLFAPWGVVIAPAGFGSLANDILIGNFGNGEILAYDPNTFAFVSTLDGSDGQPIINDHLWALTTRTGGANNNTSAVYFTAGINDEKDGLFGELTSAVPEPSTIVGTASGMLALALTKLRGKLARRS